MRKALFGLLLALPVLLLTVAGCASSGTDTAPSSAAPSSEAAPSPEAGAEAPGLPDYAYRSAQATRGYQIALKERELLAKLPCYCGCGQDQKYKNLRDCFLDEQGEFNSHAANCQVCLEEAEGASRWKAQGLTTKAIRGQIDAAYEGRGKPTDTPPVED